jgi:hypothetical protein
MEWAVALGQALGFSFAAGVNLYATIAVIGLARHLNAMAVPDQLAVFDNPWVIGGALVLFLVEFVADKVPWLDTVWDGIHTAVRPLGGALIAVVALGETSWYLQGAAAVVGIVTAASSHFTKAGTRAMVNASPEPFSNWVLSLVEDVFVLALTTLALSHPVLTAIICLVLLVAIALSARAMFRAIRRRFFSPSSGSPA